MIIVGLALHHRHNGLSTYGLNCLQQGDEHPTYILFGTWHLTFVMLKACSILPVCFLSVDMDWLPVPLQVIDRLERLVSESTSHVCSK